VGKTCRIKKGKNKGLIGIVTDSTEKDCKIEIHSNNLIITQPKEYLVEVGDSGGAMLPPQQQDIDEDSPFGMPATPSLGMQRTPLHSASTPMHATPMHTPMHDGLASHQTPRRDDVFNAGVGDTPHATREYDDPFGDSTTTGSRWPSSDSQLGVDGGDAGWASDNQSSYSRKAPGTPSSLGYSEASGPGVAMSDSFDRSENFSDYDAASNKPASPSYTAGNSFSDEHLWCCPGVECVIRDTENTAEVLSFSNNQVKVRVTGGQEKTMPIGALSKSTPVKGNQVFVHNDESYRGKTGVLTAVHEDDAVVKVVGDDGEIAFVCVEMSSIVKLVN